MKTFTINRKTITWDGNLSGKIKILDLLGIPYVPTQAETDEQSRLDSAKSTADAIPNWATWTQAEWSTYFDSNLSDAEVDLVTSLATARVMLKRQNLVINNMAKIIIAMRDQLWPDLPE